MCGLFISGEDYFRFSPTRNSKQDASEAKELPVKRHLVLEHSRYANGSNIVVLVIVLTII